MKTTLMTTCLILLGFTACAQTESELTQWQADNSEKLVMSRENFNLLDPSTQALIESSVVFDNQIGLEFKSLPTKITMLTTEHHLLVFQNLQMLGIYLSHLQEDGETMVTKIVVE